VSGVQERQPQLFAMMLAAVVAHLVIAHPHFIRCNLTTSQTLSSANIFTHTGNVMGQPIADEPSLYASISSTVFEVNESIVFTLDSSLLTQGFVHATAGTISGLAQHQLTPDCDGTETAQYGQFSNTFTWTADGPLMPTVTISLVGNAFGYGALKRTVTTLTRHCADTSDAVIQAATAGTPAALFSSCTLLAGALAATYCKHATYGALLSEYCPVSCGDCASTVTEPPTAVSPTKAPTTAVTYAPWVGPHTWKDGATAKSLLEAYAIVSSATATASPASVQGPIITLPLGLEQNGEPGIQVSWLLEESAGIVTFAIEAQTLGWVALGLAEAAGMKGSDIVMGHVDGFNGVVHIGDYHAIANAAPILDGCQDWSVLHGEEDVSGKRTLLIVRRNLTTTDSNDRPILLSSIKQLKIITAIGSHSDDGETSGDADATPMYSYHGAFKTKTGLDLRQGAALDYAGWTAAKDADASFAHIDLRVGESTANTARGSPGADTGGYLIPIQGTTYTEFCFPRSTHPGWSPAHDASTMVSFAALPDPTGRSTGHIHHFVLYGYPQDDCAGNVALPVWVGGAGLYEDLPSDVGLPFQSYASFVLQVHYDNPSYLNGVRDNSGVRVWLTTTPRAHSAGVLQLGDPSLSMYGQAIPTGGSHYTYVCSEAQTNAWNVEEITVFGSILHVSAEELLLLQHPRYLVSTVASPPSFPSSSPLQIPRRCTRMERRCTPRSPIRMVRS